MKQNKITVATHEAGHAIIVLATPLREYVKHVRIYMADDEWRGDLEMDGRDRTKIDPNCVYEVAKGLSGPMAQIHFFPTSILPSFMALIKESGGLLEATKRVVREKIGIENNWWPDLINWIRFCQDETFECSPDFIAIEKEIGRFLETDVGAQAIRDLGARLEAESLLTRDQLLSLPIAHFPLLIFPTHLYASFKAR